MRKILATVGVFLAAIDPGVSGYLADSSEWIEALRHIESQGPNELRKIGKQARASVLDTYSPEALAGMLDEILGKQK